jgi:soluble lytic murein transglycosylase
VSDAARVAGVSAPPPQKPSSAFIGVVTLYDAGLPGEAERLARLVPQSSLEGEDKLVIAWLRARDGDVRGSAMATRKLVTSPLADLDDPLVFALAYPRPHKDIVDRVAATYSLPPELIYAVIREESSFDVRAMSPRAARGLMQMMRATAQRIARDIGVRSFHAKQLFDPPVSIRFGTHYLSNLLEMFDGDVAAVAASYHAGESAVTRWRTRLGTLGVDEFIEEIPFASTRKYVQKVIASYGMYRLLYGHAGGSLMKVEGPQGTAN